jgi:predicted nucleic acid-binding Zn ribbon protein
MNRWMRLNWMLVGALIGVCIALFLLVGCGKAYKADAYICGEPPDEVTFYCKTGTGPPRTDCGLPQSGTFATKPMIC